MVNLHSINGGTPKSSIYRWIFHYKPSIFRVHPFMETPIQNWDECPRLHQEEATKAFAPCKASRSFWPSIKHVSTWRCSWRMYTYIYIYISQDLFSLAIFHIKLLTYGGHSQLAPAKTTHVDPHVELFHIYGFKTVELDVSIRFMFLQFQCKSQHCNIDHNPGGITTFSGFK